MQLVKLKTIKKLTGTKRNKMKLFYPELDIESPQCTQPLTQYKCWECPYFETNMLIHLKLHLKTNHVFQNFHTQQYNCEKCNFVTYSKYLIVRHGIIDNCSGPKTPKYTCPKCPYSCKSKLNLNRHIVIKHSNQWFECEQCLAKFKTANRLKTHKNAHMETNYLCSYCIFNTKYQGSLYRHIVTQHEDSEEYQNLPFGCQQCPLKFKRKSNLERHLKKDHNLTKQIKITRDNAGTFYNCAHCTHKSRSKQNLSAHMVVKHMNSEEIRWYYCDRCSFKAKIKAYLDRHIEKHHSDKEIKWFYCAQCPYKHERKRRLREHIFTVHRVEDKIKVYRCQRCTYRSKIEEKLEEHCNATHQGEGRKDRWYVCEYCNYKTRVKQKLQDHLEKPHELVTCGLCSFKTLWKHNLKRHLKKAHRSGAKHY